MSTKPSLTDVAKDYSNDEILDFFWENPLLCSGAAEVNKYRMVGKSIVKGIKSELVHLLPNSHINYIEPYKNSLIRVSKDSNEYMQALSELDMILSQDDINTATNLLSSRGICLSGKAGIGKGILANNIGAKLVENSNSYDSFANLVVSCASSINPNNVTWGTGMNNVEVLGAVYTVSRYAKENPKTAVVLVLDELFDCDWKSVLGKALELFSDKSRGTKTTMTNGETISYEPNLYVIVTGNIGVEFNRGNIIDERFTTRFVPVNMTGLFESKSTVDKYINYMSTLVDDEDKLIAYSDVLYEILALSEDKKMSKVVSLRALNNLVVGSKDTDSFRDGVFRLFPQSDRRDLGWVKME